MKGLQVRGSIDFWTKWYDNKKKLKRERMKNGKEKY